jgi:FkbM family methyltransferase
MNIQIIAEHSVDLNLLSGGVCIDAGCRGFKFAEAMRDLGCYVLAMDLEYMEPENPENILFMKRALMVEPGQYYYVDTKDQQAKYISNAGIPVPSISLNDLYNVVKTTDVNHIDVLKLDIEGSEYRVLADPAFQPLPKQISVEFHMHCHRKLHDQYYEACMENLLKSYVPVQHELTQAHGAGWNYWNSLFVRRDLL